MPNPEGVRVWPREESQHPTHLVAKDGATPLKRRSIIDLLLTGLNVLLSLLMPDRFAAGRVLVLR